MEWERSRWCAWAKNKDFMFLQLDNVINFLYKLEQHWKVSVFRSCLFSTQRPVAFSNTLHYSDYLNKFFQYGRACECGCWMSFFPADVIFCLKGHITLFPDGLSKYNFTWYNSMGIERSSSTKMLSHNAWHVVMTLINNKVCYFSSRSIWFNNFLPSIK